MRNLYFGGSFNPIHNGHLATAKAAARAGRFTQVVLIPAAGSPHKTDATNIASATDRLAMCELAAKSAVAEGWFAVDDLELHRPPPSYTIDTVRLLKSRGVAQVCWLIGADQLAHLPRWRDAERLIMEAHIYIMARPGFHLNFDALPPAFGSLRSNVIDVPQVDVSATDIRRRAKMGLSIDQLVPAAVADYITRLGLYRAEAP